MARGHIEKRGKNSYRIAVYQGYDGDTGEKDYYKETLRGKKKAEARLNEVLDQTEKQEFIEPSKMTLYQFLIDIFLPHVESDDSPGTLDDYTGIIENHVKNDPIAIIVISKLELIHFEQYKNRKLRSPRADGKKDKDGKPLLLSPKSVKNQLIMLKAAMVYACELKILKFSPAQYLKHPKVPKYKAKIWNEEQSVKFLETAQEDRFYFLFLLGIFYSKRKGELRGIRKSDVDLNALTASICQSVRKSGYSAIYQDTKTEESTQMLELEPWMVPFFEKEFTDREEEKKNYGPGYNDNDLVFASYNGNPVKERILTEHYNKIIKIAGIPKIRLHDLRHTCITIMLKRGWSLKHAQTRAAHADIRTTGDTYSHVTPAMQRDVNADMAKALKINHEDTIAQAQ